MQLGRVGNWLAALTAGVLLVGCSSTQKAYEGTYTSMVGSKVTLSSTSAYGAAAAAPAVTTGSVARKKLKKPYFVEFRARNALSYGHAFVVFGELDKNGKVPLYYDKDKKGVLDPKRTEIVGLHPKSNNVTPSIVGHVVPVPAESGPSDGDSEEKYVLAKYRVDLTKT